ncbi:uncharacterized protein METZ01_LOCUS470280 [marine metagenome]|uniref:Uncharacterized protein n=1 Tax=marine metagenome TaxID=408172 RepID=A0A383BB85_9ZZZZ
MHQGPGGGTGRRKGLKVFWAPRLETLGVNGVKFGETSARQGGGNPELIPG